MWATIGLAGTLETIQVAIVSPAREPLEGPNLIVAEASADGPTPITRIEFRIDGRLQCLDEEPPYQCPWDAPAPAVDAIQIRSKQQTTLELRADGHIAPIANKTAHAQAP